MKQKLIELLESLGYEAFLQGSFTSEADYPESFFTFWNVDTENYYISNEKAATFWYFTINFYSKDPNLVETITSKTAELLRENKWKVDGEGKDIPTDTPNYSARELQTIYTQKRI